MAKRGGMYSSDKRRKELKRQKKQEEKRQKRLKVSQNHEETEPVNLETESTASIEPAEDTAQETD